jgi:hypothetical protein
MRRYRNFKRKRQEKKGYHIRRTVYANDDEKNSLIRYPSNYVQTTRYNIITFLPKNLWEQFHRVANVFFVFLMVLTLTPVSPVIPGISLFCFSSSVFSFFSFPFLLFAFSPSFSFPSRLEFTLLTLLFAKSLILLLPNVPLCYSLSPPPCFCRQPPPLPQWSPS